MLADHDVVLDAVYHCPHHPDFTGRCECRKPGPGMYRAAAAALDLDTAASIYVGDRVSDVLPALSAGGTGFLVRTGYGAAQVDVPAGIRVVDDLAELAEILTDR
jgi:D-glycero-D-manno-heptose 1,7-bisphosphate phosphatase